MALAGKAVVAIWNDITPEGRTNFYEWHNREHMPERLGIDGFLRGRRYNAVPGELAGVPEYFTLYEVSEADVLAGAAYRAKLNSPTDWTKTSVAHFRNVARSLCRNDISIGSASGGFLATLRFDCHESSNAALMEQLNAVFVKLIQAPGIVACHVSRADLAVSTTKTTEQQGRPENAVPRWVVMIEASTAEAARAALGEQLGAPALASFALTDTVGGVYAVQFDLLA